MSSASSRVVFKSHIWTNTSLLTSTGTGDLPAMTKLVFRGTSSSFEVVSSSLIGQLAGPCSSYLSEQLAAAAVEHSSSVSIPLKPRMLAAT